MRTHCLLKLSGLESLKHKKTTSAPRLSSIFTLLSLSLLLSACGGGSSSSSQSAVGYTVSGRIQVPTNTAVDSGCK